MNPYLSHEQRAERAFADLQKSAGTLAEAAKDAERCAGLRDVDGFAAAAERLVELHSGWAWAYRVWLAYDGHSMPAESGMSV